MYVYAPAALHCIWHTQYSGNLFCFKTTRLKFENQSLKNGLFDMNLDQIAYLHLH